MAADYLDFLREQIELNARGPEWSAVLKDRLAALEPFVGEELIDAMFHHAPDYAILQIRPDTNAVVHVEIG